MNLLVRQYRLLGFSLVVLGLASLYGCSGGEGSPVEDGAAIDWDSPRMREIEARWRSLKDSHENHPRRETEDGKQAYADYLDSINRLFQTHLSAGDLHELAVSSKMPSLSGSGKEDFMNDRLLAFMVKEFVHTGDHQSLVEILSKRCPIWIDPAVTIENYLAFRGWRIKNPMLVLGEAYARCQEPRTRHTLATAIRRSFAGFGIQGKCDEEFVVNAMRWYEKEKGHLVVNAKYTRNETAPGGITSVDSYETSPELFDNPPPFREPLFKGRVVPPRGPKNLGEDPDR